MMESNKEEAKRCLTLAVEAFRSYSADPGTLNLEKAKRLTRKSIRLFPSEEAEGRLLRYFLFIALISHLLKSD
jgi:hypothetical protein